MYIRLEHVNVTSPNPQKTSNWMQKVFGWTILWEGETQNGGYSIHVGNPDYYIAIYKPGVKNRLISDRIHWRDTLITLGSWLMI